MQNGSILLYHANPKDIRCLKRLIPALREAGYTCVTVSDLLGLPPVPDERDALDPLEWLVVDEPG